MKKVLRLSTLHARKPEILILYLVFVVYRFNQSIVIYILFDYSSLKKTVLWSFIKIPLKLFACPNKEEIEFVYQIKKCIYVLTA